MNSYKLFIALTLLIPSILMQSQTVVDKDLFLFGTDNLPGSASVADTFYVFDRQVGGTFLGIQFDGGAWHRDSIGPGSFAAGYGSQATGDRGATATGYYSDAIGDWGAVALGENNTASGEHGATAIGYKNLAEGLFGATALGNNTTAAGDNGATALGYQTSAMGAAGATAMGYETTAGGEFGATALGSSTQAHGEDGSTAIGYLSKSFGDKGATAIGDNTIVNGNSCVVVGLYNDTIVAAGTSISDESPIFIVGNGDNHLTRSNAMVIKKNGRVGINRTPINKALELGGNASKATAGNWLANSDRRIKTDINDIEDSFTTLLKLRPVTFKYSDEWLDRNPGIKDQYYSNFIAQEYAAVFPEAVQGSGEYLENDSDEILQIDTYDAQIVNIKATQELILKVQSLEKENEEMKEVLRQIQAQLTN